MLRPASAPLFDAYVAIDWSAAAKPVIDSDSVWIALAERHGAELVERRLANPPTRDQAMALLADWLSDLAARGQTTLVACDFPFGYPAGFARRLDPRRPDWRGVWRQWAVRFQDGADNANDRFAAAAKVNADTFGRAFPFWGCAAGRAAEGLAAKRPAGFADHADAVAGAPAEWRLCERRAKGTQSVWKLYGQGSAGSQALLGIARLEKLRHHPWLADKVKLWPFETGLAPLARPEPGSIVMAETWPGLFPLEMADGEIRDRAQVRAVWQALGRLDETGALSRLFAGDPALTPAERARVEAEEGWILGVGAGLPPSAPAAARPAYERDPAAITRQSFAIIRAEADLARFPPAMEAVAVRVVHACGMPEVAAALVFTRGAAEAGQAALAAGRPVLTDVQMVARGVTRRRLPAANPVLCLLDDPRVAALARRQGTTRSAAAVDLWAEHLAGAVVAIGNAPTALFRLLELVAAGAPRPALVLGFPVGFVGAAESKQALICSGLPHVALPGRRGGSAMAAAAVNALGREDDAG